MAVSDRHNAALNDGRVAYLRPQGFIDAAGAVVLRSQTEEVLAVPGTEALAADFSQVTSLDSAGIGWLVWVREKCLDADVALTLHAVSSTARRLLAMIGLEALFDLRDDVPTPGRDAAPAAVDPTEARPAPPAAAAVAFVSTSGPLAEDLMRDQAFDRFASLARRLLGVPVATVALVDRQRHRLPGIAGVEGEFARTREVPLSHSFCSNVVRRGTSVVLTDARADPATAGHPAVREYGLVAYAGLPLTDLDGHILGTLCVSDSVPRAWTAAELDTLADIAAACSAEMQLRGAIGAAAVSADRERMARHLHEHVTGELLQLSLKVGSARSLSDGRAADLLDQSIQSIDAVLKNIRQTLYASVA